MSRFAARGVILVGLTSLATADGACRPASPASRVVVAGSVPSADAGVPRRIAHLCVTAGRVDTRGPGRFHVDVGGMRGTAALRSSRQPEMPEMAELAFTYRGPSATTEPLASGELRRQIGLKLRAQDTCNVVYVMWHLEPSPGIFVSVKRNPGASTHSECGDRGYVNVASTATALVAPARLGQAHTLRAELQGDLLSVRADGELAWEARLPSVARELEGPPGVRSDNGAFDFELLVPGGDSTSLDCSRQ